MVDFARGTVIGRRGRKSKARTAVLGDQVIVSHDLDSGFRIVCTLDRFALFLFSKNACPTKDRGVRCIVEKKMSSVLMIEPAGCHHGILRWPPSTRLMLSLQY
jgi:hypothetical protein